MAAAQIYGTGKEGGQANAWVGYKGAAGYDLRSELQGIPFPTCPV
jgi:hypothetical protein